MLCIILFITARNEVGARLCFYTCLSFCAHGESVSLHSGIHTPQEQNPPGSRHDTPYPTPRSRPTPGADTPQEQTPQEETRNPPRKKPGRPPRRVVHAGRYGQQAGGTHPTGMHPCFGLNLEHVSEQYEKSGNGYLCPALIVGSQHVSY